MRESKTSNSCLHVHTYRPIRARLVDQVFYELKKKKDWKSKEAFLLPNFNYELVMQ